MTHSRLLCRLGAVALLLGSGPAVGSQRPSPLPPGSWNVDWGERHCALIRHGDGSPPADFVLMTTPGSRIWQVRLVSREWPEAALSRPERLEMTFEPGGVDVHGATSVERTEGGQALVRYQVPEILLESFASAQSVRVAQGGLPILEIALPGVDRALASLRECESSVMSDWGAEPAAQARIPVPPRHPGLASIVTHFDYPAEALRHHQTGTVTFRLMIEANGRVSDCSILVSSGHPILDRRTCTIVRERARFEPARDADGNPVPGLTVSSITWAILSR